MFCAFYLEFGSSNLIRGLFWLVPFSESSVGTSSSGVVGDEEAGDSSSLSFSEGSFKLMRPVLAGEAANDVK